MAAAAAGSGQVANQQQVHTYFEQIREVCILARLMKDGNQVFPNLESAEKFKKMAPEIRQIANLMKQIKGLESAMKLYDFQRDAVNLVMPSFNLRFDDPTPEMNTPPGGISPGWEGRKSPGGLLANPMKALLQEKANEKCLQGFLIAAYVAHKVFYANN